MKRVSALHQTRLQNLSSTMLAAAGIASTLFISTAAATTFNVSDDASLRAALTSAGAGDTINLTTNITITGGDLPAIQRNITVQGNNFTLNGNNAARGLFVYSGTVAISNLTITGAVAQGGAGGAGAPGGGGGAGLGAGIFVASGANVTTSNVQVLNNSAVGGAGGAGNTALFGAAGGGGLGGSGASIFNNVTGGGGGGGIGSAAVGGNASTSGNGGNGIVLGAAAGGQSSSGNSGGLNGGGGGTGFYIGNIPGGGGGGIGGGNGSGTPTSGIAGNGGFGGGGGGSFGTGGNGGFGGGGGGSGATGGVGGFGGGGGGTLNATTASGGFGAGSGGQGPAPAGGGGAGLGGGIFVQEGGSLTLGSGGLSLNSAVAGASGSSNAGGTSATAGSAFGSGIFLQGNGTLNLAPAIGTTQTISNVIADQSGSGGTGPNAGSWGATMNGAGTVNLNGANTFSGGLTVNNGTVNLGAANVFNYSGGTTVNGGALNTTADNTIHQSLTVNGGTFNVGASSQDLGGGGAATVNGGAVTIAGGFFNANGLTINSNGALSGYGQLFNLTSGTPYSNSGTITVTSGQNLSINALGGPLQNNGFINLNNGALSSTIGGVDNVSGIVTGGGVITNGFTNSGGTIAVEALQQMTIGNFGSAWSNGGIIQMDSTTALLKGDTISNTGAIQGIGRINSDISNSGQVSPGLGSLVLGGTLTNNADGTVGVGLGSILNFTHSTSNAGLFSMAGGNVTQAATITLTNTGTLSGFGTLNGGALDNQNTATFAGGTATINQTVTNEASGKMTVDHAPAVFNRSVTNNGTFTVNGTTATFNAGFTNNGTFITDPATLVFTDFNQGVGGSVVASAGDLYKVSANFNNQSQQNLTWNTLSAILEMTCASGTCNHNFLLAGADLGALIAGFTNNFAWDTLTIDSGSILKLIDGNAGTSGGAFYADTVLGALIVAGVVTNIDGADGLNIYYNPLFAGNAYLGDQTYALNGGGELIPIGNGSETPLPAALPLFATGLGALGLLGWRRKKKAALA